MKQFVLVLGASRVSNCLDVIKSLWAARISVISPDDLRSTALVVGYSPGYRNGWNVEKFVASAVTNNISYKNYQ